MLRGAAARALGRRGLHAPLVGPGLRYIYIIHIHTYIVGPRCWRRSLSVASQHGPLVRACSTDLCIQALRCCGCRLRPPSPPPGSLCRQAPQASLPPTTSAWSRVARRSRAHPYPTPALTLIPNPSRPRHTHTPHPTPHTLQTRTPHPVPLTPRGPGGGARLRARARLGTRCLAPGRRGRAPLLPRAHGRRWYAACDPSTARPPAPLAMCRAHMSCMRPHLVQSL